MNESRRTEVTTHSTDVTQPNAAAKPRSRARLVPRFHLVLWNDDDHSYDYVIRMLQQLFGFSFTRAYMIAEEVDKTGRSVVLTTTKEHAEFKREQILAFGRDPMISQSRGAMTATIEPAD